MFRDLKEYQEIQKIYEENVYSTPEEKIVIDVLEEQNFTLEELEYIIENIDEVLSDTYITEGIEQEQLDEFAKAVVKAAVPLAKRMAQGFSKNVNKIPAKNVVGGSAAKTIEKGKNLLKTGADKIKPFMSGAKQKFKSVVDKIKKPIMNNKAAVGGASALGAVTVAGAATQLKGKKPSNTDASGKVIPTTAEIRAKAAAKRGGTPAIGGGNAGASTDSGGTSKSTIKSVEQKPDKFVEKNPPKEGSARAKMRAKNVERFGKERVQKLVQKNQEFQAAKKSGNLAQFRKDNPKVSGADRAKQMAKDRLAKKAAMEEYTPYDIVLEYLLSTEQVATIEEANYVMTEMDAETIQSIVSN